MPALTHSPATALLAAALALFTATTALANLIIDDPAEAKADPTRHALVIGIDTYDAFADLLRAVADARAMAEALEAAGFAVTLLTDPADAELDAALETMLHAIGPGDPVLFYFAGHAIGVEGRTLLLMRDTALPERPAPNPALMALGLPFEDLPRLFQRAGAGPVAQIADTCRDNPFAQPDSTRMHRPDTRKQRTITLIPEARHAEGQMLVYPVEVGQCPLELLSAEDDNPNSLFMRHLLPRMAEPGLSLQEAVQATRVAVLADLGGRYPGHRAVVHDSLSAPFVITLPER